jgi:DNA-binding MarR family transcriptional regulator
MSFDSLVTNPGRLRILTALARVEDRQSFVEVRRRTGLTDGNLATHARRLQSAGFIAIEKSIASGKPLTTLQLTRSGREALVHHARELAAALDGSARPHAASDLAADISLTTTDVTDDWVD